MGPDRKIFSTKSRGAIRCRDRDRGADGRNVGRRHVRLEVIRTTRGPRSAGVAPTPRPPPSGALPMRSPRIRLAAVGLAAGLALAPPPAAATPRRRRPTRPPPRPRPWPRSPVRTSAPAARPCPPCGAGRCARMPRAPGATAASINPAPRRSSSPRSPCAWLVDHLLNAPAVRHQMPDRPRLVRQDRRSHARRLLADPPATVIPKSLTPSSPTPLDARSSPHLADRETAIGQRHPPVVVRHRVKPPPHAQRDIVAPCVDSAMPPAQPIAALSKRELRPGLLGGPHQRCRAASPAWPRTRPPPPPRTTRRCRPSSPR